MRRSEVSVNLVHIRRLRTWTQGKLADEAGVSPTTVSGIERGRISRPHPGTIRKLADALGVDPEQILAGRTPAGGTPAGRAPAVQRAGRPSRPLSLEWAMTVREEEFERGLDEATLEGLGELLRLLDEEQERLRKLHEQFPWGSEQQRFIKRQIRNVAAHSGSVDASLSFLQDKEPRRRFPR